jgi:hypothetical protein
MPFSLASMPPGVFHYPDRLMSTTTTRASATRAIVTLQPDVICDVCGRRLLRGEHPDAFLAGGERRLVCELCVPRAVQEGWLRESGERLVGAFAEPRPRGRGRGLFRRLRWREPLPDPALEDTATIEGEAPVQASAARGPWVSDPPAGSPAALAEVVLSVRAPQAPAENELVYALDVFNAGEHPRRVAGVARSLGAPSVNVRLSADATVVTIVVAWELSWYRYEVHLGEEMPAARAVAQGTELGELAPHERRANARADERGMLVLVDA